MGRCRTKESVFSPPPLPLSTLMDDGGRVRNRRLRQLRSKLAALKSAVATYAAAECSADQSSASGSHREVTDLLSLALPTSSSSSSSFSSTSVSSSFSTTASSLSIHSGSFARTASRPTMNYGKLARERVKLLRAGSTHSSDMPPPPPLPTRQILSDIPLDSVAMPIYKHVVSLQEYFRESIDRLCDGIDSYDTAVCDTAIVLRGSSSSRHTEQSSLTTPKADWNNAQTRPNRVPSLMELSAFTVAKNAPIKSDKEGCLHDDEWYASIPWHLRRYEFVKRRKFV